MIRSYALLLAAAAVGLCATTAKAAQTVSFQQDVNGYTGCVDNELSGNAPDRPGTDPTHDITWVDFPTDQTLLRFDNIFGNGTNQIPLGSAISDATIVPQTGNSGDCRGAGAQIFRMLKPWTSTDSYNLWGNGIQPDGLEARSIPSAGCGYSYSTVYIDVRSDIQVWANGTPNFGWVFLPLTGNFDGWGFFNIRCSAPPCANSSSSASPHPSPNPPPPSFSSLASLDVPYDAEAISLNDRRFGF